MEQPTISYREYLPDPRLRPWVECYWCIRELAPSEEYRAILPDACSDIIFNFSDPLLYEEGATVKTNSFSSFYVGIQSRPVYTRASHHLDLFAIRFKNEGAWLFLQRPLGNLKDQVVSLEQLEQKELGLLTGEMAFLTFDQRRLRLENELLKRLANLKADPIFGGFNRLLPHKVTGMAKELGLSERSLERKIKERVGMSPKQYQRVARFRAATEKLPSYRGSLMEFAWDMGYYDHAHLTRDFLELGRVLPSQLVGQH